MEIAYLEWVQHEAQTRTLWRKYRLLVVALTARRHIVHLRPDVWGCHGGWSILGCGWCFVASSRFARRFLYVGRDVRLRHIARRRIANLVWKVNVEAHIGGLASTRKLLEVTCPDGARKCPALHPTLLRTSHCICIEAQIHIMLKDCTRCSDTGCKFRKFSHSDCQNFLHVWLLVPATPQLEYDLELYLGISDSPQ
jgi:hypothetical protein